MNGEVITYPAQDVWHCSTAITDYHIPAWSLHRLLILFNMSIEFEDWNLDEAYEHIIIWIEDAIRGGLFNKDYLEERK